MQQRVERPFERELRTLLRKQFFAAAKDAESGRHNFDDIIEKADKDVRKLFEKRYRGIANVFGPFFFEEAKAASVVIETKSVLDEFWKELNRFIGGEALRKAKTINSTTKETFRDVVRSGLSEGATNATIAKRLREVGAVHSAFRANRIVRTEVHTTMTTSLHKASALVPSIKKKEWLSANDDRTRVSTFNHRAAHGEVVAMDQAFVRTGEALMYPGDPAGSAGNVINCRCVELYVTG
jgi:hypothetical protein